MLCDFLKYLLIYLLPCLHTYLPFFFLFFYLLISFLSYLFTAKCLPNVIPWMNLMTYLSFLTYFPCLSGRYPARDPWRVGMSNPSLVLSVAVMIAICCIYLIWYSSNLLNNLVCPPTWAFPPPTILGDSKHTSKQMYSPRSSKPLWRLPWLSGHTKHQHRSAVPFLFLSPRRGTGCVDLAEVLRNITKPYQGLK